MAPGIMISLKTRSNDSSCEDAQRVVGIGGQPNRMTELHDERGRNLGNVGIVFDDQNARFSARDGLILLGRSF